LITVSHLVLFGKSTREDYNEKFNDIQLFCGDFLENEHFEGGQKKVRILLKCVLENQVVRIRN